MRREAIDWRGGEITHWGFPDGPGDEWDLREDLLMIEYGRTTLSAGWYPSMDPAGRYIVHVVSNEAWDEPLLEREARTELELEAALREAVNLAASQRR